MTSPSIADKVALAPIAAGSPILASQFGEPGESAVLPLPPGKIAVSLRLDDSERVAGFVEPGLERGRLPHLDAAAGPEVTRVLLKEVPVIAAGATTLVQSSDGEEG